jgi:hypothetical protein
VVIGAGPAGESPLFIHLRVSTLKLIGLALQVSCFVPHWQDSGDTAF